MPPYPCRYWWAIFPSELSHWLTLVSLPHPRPPFHALCAFLTKLLITHLPIKFQPCPTRRHAPRIPPEGGTFRSTNSPGLSLAEGGDGPRDCGKLSSDWPIRPSLVSALIWRKNGIREATTEWENCSKWRWSRSYFQVFIKHLCIIVK